MGGLRLKHILIGAALGLPLLALLYLWLERRPIARNAIDRALVERHVRARYVVSAIGPRTQRLQNIVIGDPARPDLTADSATVVLGWWITGPDVRTVAASGVRLHGRITRDGTLSLGEIDKLLPAPSGKPFALPDLNVAVSDARIALDTPAGPIAMTLRGTGNLQDGFSGSFGAVASALDTGGCRIEQPSLFASVSIRDREPMIDGPLRAARLACPQRKLAADALWIALKLRLNAGLDRWSGSSGIALGQIALGKNRVEAVRGTIGFTGDQRHSEADVAVVSGAVTAAGVTARRMRVAGRAAIDGASAYGFTGDSEVDGLSVPAGQIVQLRKQVAALGATPVGPVLAAWTDALGRAASNADISARLTASSTTAGGTLVIDSADGTSASGARLSVASEGGLRYTFGAAKPEPFGATVSLGGGGLPRVDASLVRIQAGAPATGEIRLATYAAGNARIGATPIGVTIHHGVTRLRGSVAMDGPLAGGRVAGLIVPLDLQVGTSGALLLNPGCAPVRFSMLEISGAKFGRANLPLCPTGRALFARSASGATAGGGRLVAPKLAGTLGGSPLTIAARDVGFDAARGDVLLRALAVRLGEGSSPTKLDVAALTARSGAKGVAGTFDGAAGQIGAVPLLLSDAAGKWTLIGARLALDGGLKVADSAGPARYHPLVSRDVRLTLDDGRIHGEGWLLEPKSSRRVARVVLDHALSSGAGRATLSVQDLAFDGGLQPEALTPLTLGVVADMKGSVRGEGHIAWDAKGVRSDGRFGTDDLALAAAFGPVSGIKGTITFSDLLGMATPPHQEVVLGQVNPGIAVFGGKVRYQLLTGQRVQVESGNWPLAGGRLELEATLLDFSRPTTRRFPFDVIGLDAGQFIEQFKLDNISATGTFDGVLPMIFDDKGGRIVGGRLVARSPGGRLSYVGEVSNAQLGTYGTLAFDALKSIRYQALRLDLDGALDGEVVSRISFAGTNDRPSNVAPAKGISKQFSNLPFKFNIVVRAPFRGLLNSAAAFADPGALLKNPQSVQPQESGAVPLKP